MKAIRVPQFGGPEVLKLDEVADPGPPGPGQVLVRVRAAGVNPVETYIRSGIYGERKFPFTPGADAGGEVEAVGDGVNNFRPGDRVYTSGSITGTYAELALFEAEQVHGLPAPITFQQGAALGVPYGTAYRALFHRGGARAGETLLVHGASGGVGTACVQLARAAGLTIIGTAGSDKGRQLVEDQGADHVLDHNDAGYRDQIRKLTEDRGGVDLIMEMLANVNLGHDLKLLAKFGRVVVIGSRGPVEITPRDTMRNDADIRGMTLANASYDDLVAIHQALIAGLERGTVRPVVGQEFPLAEAPRAHEAVMAPGAYGKIVLVP